MGWAVRNEQQRAGQAAQLTVSRAAGSSSSDPTSTPTASARTQRAPTTSPRPRQLSSARSRMAIPRHRLALPPKALPFAVSQNRIAARMASSCCARGWGREQQAHARHRQLLRGLSKRARFKERKSTTRPWEEKNINTQTATGGAHPTHLVLGRKGTLHSGC